MQYFLHILDFTSKKKYIIDVTKHILFRKSLLENEEEKCQKLPRSVTSWHFGFFSFSLPPQDSVVLLLWLSTSFMEKMNYLERFRDESVVVTLCLCMASTCTAALHQCLSRRHRAKWLKCRKNRGVKYMWSFRELRRLPTVGSGFQDGKLFWPPVMKTDLYFSFSSQFSVHEKKDG